MKSTNLSQIFEEKYFEEGYDYVVGIDEVGRGPWAGPMYLCAYVYAPTTRQIPGITDSKKLSLSSRVDLHSKLTSKNPTGYFLEKVSASSIDLLSLGKCIRVAIENLTLRIDSYLAPKKVKYLVDGAFNYLEDEKYECVIKGDSRVYSISCASVIAKVERDNFMKSLAIKHPDYGFEKHVGYGTRLHLERILMHGLIDGIHRFSYKPIAEISSGYN